MAMETSGKVMHCLGRKGRGWVGRGKGKCYCIHAEYWTISTFGCSFIRVIFPFEGWESVEHPNVRLGGKVPSKPDHDTKRSRAQGLRSNFVLQSSGLRAPDIHSRNSQIGKYGTTCIAVVLVSVWSYCRFHLAWRVVHVA